MANKNTKKKKQKGGGDDMPNIIQAILEMKVILFLPVTYIVNNPDKFTDYFACVDSKTLLHLVKELNVGDVEAIEQIFGGPVIDKPMQIPNATIQLQQNLDVIKPDLTNMSDYQYYNQFLQMNKDMEQLQGQIHRVKYEIDTANKQLSQFKCVDGLDNMENEFITNFILDCSKYSIKNVDWFKVILDIDKLDDGFNKDVEKIWETHTDDIGKLATYWSTDIFNHFNQPYGSLMPNEHFINKSRGQLFSTIQIAVLLGYTDIRLLGVDLNDEGKFQDDYDDAPYSAKSVGNGGEKLKARLSAFENMKDQDGVHNTCQGTKDKDYLGIHKLINIFTNKCLKNNGVFLTVCNSNSLLTKVNINYQSIIGEIKMEKITFCIPSKNNRRYLEACIPSIRKNTYRKDHDIIVFVDEDNDGTVEWLESVKEKYNVKYIVNDTDELYGIGKYAKDSWEIFQMNNMF